jgi:hypothetical protein
MTRRSRGSLFTAAHGLGLAWPSHIGPANSDRGYASGTVRATKVE